MKVILDEREKPEHHDDVEKNTTYQPDNRSDRGFFDVFAKETTN
jgi:hypothetical protein